MADTLTNIQDGVRFWSDDSNLTVTSGTNLRIANTVYQGMFSPEYTFMGVHVGRRWPEATQEDTSLTMVAGTEAYNWPTSPVFKGPFVIEGLDTNDNNEPYLILPAPDLTTWSAYDQNTNDRPVYWRRIDASGTAKLELRPKPDQTDGIRINGLIEVTEFTGGSDSTVFLNTQSDRAYAMLLGAHFLAKRGKPGRALEVVQMAAGLLPAHDITPSLTGTGRVRPWNYGEGLSRRRYL